MKNNHMHYQRLKDLREDNDLTQTQVAKMLGMSQTDRKERY